MDFLEVLDGLAVDDDERFTKWEDEGSLRLARQANLVVTQSWSKDSGVRHDSRGLFGVLSLLPSPRTTWALSENRGIEIAVTRWSLRPGQRPDCSERGR